MSWAKYKRLSSSKDLSIFRRGTTASDGGGGAANDPDAQAYIDALDAAGYTVSGAEETAINNHFLDLKGTGPNNSTYDWWTGCVRLLPFIGTNAAQQGIEGQNPASAINFYGGMTFSSIGAEGNGTNAYFDFFAPNEIPDNYNNSLWVYETKNLNDNNQILYLGELEGNVGYGIRFWFPDKLEGRHGYANYAFRTPDNTLVPPTTGGFYGTTRHQTCEEGGFFDLYLRGAKYTANLSSCGNFTNTADQVPGLARRVYSFGSYAYSQFSPCAIGYALITTGVSTTTEEAALRACVEAFMTALNREV